MCKLKDNNLKVALATKNGAYLLSPDKNRKNWKLSKPFLVDENVNKVIDDSHGTLFAATLSEGVFKSTDGGESWKSSSKGLNVRKVWEVAASPHIPGLLYAGTQYGHLFKSVNSGDTWEEITSLYAAPDRENWGIDWGYGTTGLALHTIRFDPGNPDRIYIVASGNGTYRSDDGGETWKSLKNGLNSTCPVGEKDMSYVKAGLSPEEALKKHLSDVHSCSHKIVVSPKNGMVFQQNHCGTYFSNDRGDHWNDVSVSTKLRFGFSIDVVEDPTSSVFVVPVPDTLNECKEHNVCIQGQLTVYRTSDGGKSWDRLTNGLPQNVHTNVLRDCLTHDNSDNHGIYFGTSTGDLYFSENLGDSWENVVSGLGRIQGVNAVET